jgi:protein O-mannosyl-transferase
MNVSRTKLMGVAVVIFTGTVWLYWPSTHGEFLRGDDKDNLQQAVRWNGLTWNAVQWAFTNAQPYYQALPRLSHVLDYQIWGTNASGHHATSVVLHALNAALVFGFLWTLLAAETLTSDERLMMALGVSVVFAIHPLQVETVAWISGRTHLLCATFGIGTLWAYTAGTRRWVVWLLFAGALLSQPIAVSLPFVMLAIDCFARQQHERVAWGRLLHKKAAFITLALAVGLATMLTATRVNGNMARLESVPLSQHVLLMFHSLAFYPWEIAWPVHLSPYYPVRFGLSLYQWPVFASVLSIGIITTILVWYRQRLPALAAAWAAYLAFLLPVSGLMQTSWEMTAPRYAYLAILPLLLLVGGAIVWLWRRGATAMRVVVACVLAGELCIFGVCTQSQILVWRNDEMLWRAALQRLPDWEMANRVLALGLLDQGRGREALECAQRYVEIAPQQCESHNTLGLVLAQLGRPQDAVGQYEEALRINPDYAQAQLNLGAAMGKLGKPDDAIRHYEEALRIRPDYAEADIDLGIVLLQQNRAQEAIGHFEHALRIDSNYAAVAHMNIANALLLQGSAQDAIRQYEQALRIDPENAEAHGNFGAALAQVGRESEAIEHFEQALRINPYDVEAHYNLAVALERTGRTPEAIEHYQQALKFRPDFVPAKSALARLGVGQ